MKLKDKITKFFGIQFYDKLTDLEPDEYENFSGNKILNRNSFFYGNCNGNLIVEEDIKVTIVGNFKGNIIGKNGSWITIQRNFEGILFGEYLRFCESSQVQSNFFAHTKTIIENGAVIHGKGHITKFVVTTSELNSWNLDYIASIEFKEQFQNL